MTDPFHKNKKSTKNSDLNAAEEADNSLLRRSPDAAPQGAEALTSPYLKGADKTRGKRLADSDRTRIMHSQQPANEAPENHSHYRPPENPPTPELEAPVHMVLKSRFVLEQVVGVGGMGVVYKAKDLRKVEARDRNPYLAVKILNDDFRKHPDAVIALQREARKSQSIAHPNIVNVHDFDRDGDTVFMTMEYLDGNPLDKLLRERMGHALKSAHAMEIFKGMCAALQHAHSENIVHADFKPGNVFVTRSGATKVFDFGIARAVAQVDSRLLHHDNTLLQSAAFANHSDNGEAHDKSVFDPGTLGALTPAYASLEMLQGETPTVQDDIYALAIVAYQLFAGEHPYQRANALDALSRNMKPKRIKCLSRQQWKTLKSALAFHRDKRPASVYEFFYDFTHEQPSPLSKWVATAALLVLGVGLGIGVYTQYFYEKPLSPEELKAQLERQIKFDLVKKNITALVQDSNFSQLWQEDLWREVRNARDLVGLENPWLIDAEARVSELYLKRIQAKRSAGQYNKVQALLTNAERYRGNHGALEQERLALNNALRDYHDTQQRLEKERLEKERLAQERQEKLAQLELQKKAQQKEQQLAQQKAREKQQREKARAARQQALLDAQRMEAEQAEKDIFALALNNVKQQLRCKGDLDERNLKAATDKLKTVDASRYKLEVPGIVSAIGVCIERIGERDSNRALDLKKFALTLFPGNRVLANLKITPKDPCGEMLAGFGARGIKGTCRDRLDNGTYGPRLVVVPAAQGVSVYAIGQFEISVGEINDYCRQTKECTPLRADSDLPATELSFSVAKAYTRWLSRNTGYTYRIPRYKEWLYAAQAQHSPLDDNRNCTLNARGINKGEQLENVTTGKKNKWGLVNPVGNAQEWVLVNNRDLAAAGGAHVDPMQQCQYDTRKNHDGTADAVTGFRVVRDLKKL